MRTLVLVKFVQHVNLRSCRPVGKRAGLLEMLEEEGIQVDITHNLVWVKRHAALAANCGSTDASDFTYSFAVARRMFD